MLVPVGVVPDVVIVMVVEHAGVHDVGENDEVAPDGRPDAEKDTGWAVPDSNVDVIEFVTEDDCDTMRAPLFDNEKLNDGNDGGGGSAAVIQHVAPAHVRNTFNLLCRSATTEAYAGSLGLLVSS